MNDKPTASEMVFGGFLLVFGIIAGIGIEKQILSSKPPNVIYEYGNGWKTGSGSNIVIYLTNTGNFHLKLDGKEPVFQTNKFTEKTNPFIVHPEPEVAWSERYFTMTNSWISIHNTSGTLFKIDTNKFGYYIRSSLKPHVSLTNNTEFPWLIRFYEPEQR